MSNSTNPSDTVRYGLIGSGMMGVEHLENIAHLDGAVVTAVSDPVEERREIGAATVTSFGGKAPTLFADHRELIDSGLCDAVVIASPNMTHVDVLGDVLGSDLHVLVEKPLCTTVEDCHRVVDAAAMGHARYGHALAADDRARGRAVAVLSQQHQWQIGLTSLSGLFSIYP